jgi:hypothetical protein
MGGIAMAASPILDGVGGEKDWRSRQQQKDV